MEGIDPSSPLYKSGILTIILHEHHSSQNFDESITGGIRTHEAEAQALKACPFDRSGTVIRNSFLHI